MRAKLKVSVYFNVILLAVLSCLCAARRKPGNAGVTPASAVVPPAVQTRVEREPFQWSQIESTDYPTYIANLRRIGCPRQTIRDIISADVHSLYAPRRGPLEENKSSSDAAVRLAAERGLSEVQREEAAVVAALLGDNVVAPGSSQETVAAAPAGRRPPARTESVSLPLVFQNVDLSKLKLDPGQIQALEDLRQSFIDQIGGPNQDPKDPAYRARWQQAQPEIDDMMRGMIGIPAWQDYQLAARDKAEEQSGNDH